MEGGLDGVSLFGAANATVCVQVVVDAGDEPWEGLRPIDSPRAIPVESLQVLDWGDRHVEEKAGQIPALDEVVVKP